MTCTFFGHRNTPNSVRNKLRITLTDLIENKNVDRFYIGNHGAFDKMAVEELEQLKVLYPHIDYTVVLAYYPANSNTINNYKNTIYPEELALVPKRFAIEKRGIWMIQASDIAIVYVKRTGGAKKLSEIARTRGLEIINITDDL